MLSSFCYIFLVNPVTLYHLALRGNNTQTTVGQHTSCNDDFSQYTKKR